MTEAHRSAETKLRRFRCVSYCRCGSQGGHFEIGKTGAWMLSRDVSKALKALRAEIRKLRKRRGVK